MMIYYLLIIYPPYRIDRDVGFRERSRKAVMGLEELEGRHRAKNEEKVSEVRRIDE